MVMFVGKGKECTISCSEQHGVTVVAFMFIMFIRYFNLSYGQIAGLMERYKTIRAIPLKI